MAVCSKTDVLTVTTAAAKDFTQQLVALPSDLQVSDSLLQDLSQNHQPLQLHQHRAHVLTYPRKKDRSEAHGKAEQPGRPGICY